MPARAIRKDQRGNKRSVWSLVDREKEEEEEEEREGGGGGKGTKGRTLAIAPKTRVQY